MTGVIATQVAGAWLGWQDLARRRDDQVRGPKWAWRVLLAIQPGNAAFYWIVGRRD